MPRRAKPVFVEVEGGDELIAELRALGVDVEMALKEATLAGGQVLVDEMNDLAPGPHIDAEVRSATPNKVTLDIGPDPQHWYYRFFETGVQPHEITPRTKKALAFDDVVVKRVTKHPGMAARPFMRPVADTRADEAAAAVGGHLAAVIERHRE